MKLGRLDWPPQRVRKKRMKEKQIKKKATLKKKSTARPSAVAVPTQAKKPVIAKTSISAPVKAAKSSHHATSCSILDPFCVHAKGARRPDGLGTQTMPYQSRATVAFGTDASGNGRMVFVPGYGAYGWAYCGTSGADWGVPANWTDMGTGKTFLDANAAEVRLVSFGVRILSIMSATDCKGYCIIGTQANPVVSAVQPKGRTAYPEHSIRPLTAGFETTWHSKPAGASAHDFRPYTSVTNTMSDFDWSSLSVEIAGSTASSNVFVIEVIQNIELTFKETAGAMTALIPPSKPANPVALQVQRQIQASVPSIFDTTVAQTSKFIESKVSSVLPDLLTGAMAFLGL